MTFLRAKCPLGKSTTKLTHAIFILQAFKSGSVKKEPVIDHEQRTSAFRKEKEVRRVSQALELWWKLNERKIMLFLLALCFLSVSGCS